GQRPVMDRHFPPGVSHLSTQVVAVKLAQLVAGDAPQPEEKRHLWPAAISPQVLPGRKVRVLQHIGGIDAALEPLIESKGHHAAKPRTALCHQGFPRRWVALRSELQALVDFRCILWHRVNPLLEVPRVDLNTIESSCWRTCHPRAPPSCS